MNNIEKVIDLNKNGETTYPKMYGRLSEFLGAGFGCMGWLPEIQQRSVHYRMLTDRSASKRFREGVKKVAPYMKELDRNGFAQITVYGTYDTSSRMYVLFFKKNLKEFQAIEMSFGVETVLKEFSTLNEATKYLKDLVLTGECDND